MANTLSTVIPLGSESRISDPEFHSRVNELNHHNNARDRGRDNHDYLRVSLAEVVRRQSDPLLRIIRRYSRFRFGMELNNCWKRLHVRNNNKSSQPSPLNNRNRKRNRHYLYYGLLVSLLSIAPARAEENNVSNPVAAATGNVTNQAVQFQNNGAPSRQHYGPNISCNGATMTFSPFYMGNHTKPWDIDDDGMRPSSYTMAENWGGQINFMVPLDREGLNRCRSIAERQEEKMRLDYELVRVLKCAELQQKGFMLIPGSRTYDMCSDVIAIASWKKAEKEVLQCNTPPKPWYKPWKTPKPNCKK